MEKLLDIENVSISFIQYIKRFKSHEMKLNAENISFKYPSAKDHNYIKTIIIGFKRVH